MKWVTIPKLSSLMCCLAFGASCVSVALAGEAKSHNPKREAAADGKVSRGGFDLHYRVFGDKGAFLVVLSGGPGSDPGYMKPMVDELSGKFRYVLLEQRGTSRSELTNYDTTTVNFSVHLEDLEALRKQLATDKLLLLGHSWGGMPALSYGGTYPDRTLATVTLAAGPSAEEHAEAEEENAKRRLLPNELDQVTAREKRKPNEPV